MIRSSRIDYSRFKSQGELDDGKTKKRPGEEVCG